VQLHSVPFTVSPSTAAAAGFTGGCRLSVRYNCNAIGKDKRDTQHLYNSPVQVKTDSMLIRICAGTFTKIQTRLGRVLYCGSTFRNAFSHGVKITRD
jgi:hypothetical protein